VNSVRRSEVKADEKEIKLGSMRRGGRRRGRGRTGGRMKETKKTGRAAY
jgi:hypothetical protein